uniref:Growth-regulating factor n=2 Tax=Cannabis sativa TaxID=3483 RepID=A0A803QST4_CANSA
MDFHLKQWRNQQHESEHHQQHSAKIPKLVIETHHMKQDLSSTCSEPLPLFVPEPPNITKMITTGTLSTDSTTSPTTRIPRGGMGSYFSLAQWQELELQALIFRYMLAGATVPSELLQHIKKSFNLLHTTPYFLHHSLQPYPHFQPSPTLLQSGYWGKASMDPEPGRCRRTDGKKWRCSRDVVVGQKYCERHMHRGRNRSRKPVEIPTPTTTTTGGGRLAGDGVGRGTLASNNGPSPLSTSSNAAHFSLSMPTSSIDLLHLNNRRMRKSPMSSASSLSISITGNNSSSTSDISLKLSTGGNGEEMGHPEAHSDRQQQSQLGWASSGWASNPMASMGGPLAEALRSSNSNSSSPTSVLHQLPPRSSASDTCIVST